MSSTSSPVKRFKMAFDVTGSDCHPKPTKFFAIESKDSDIKGLKTRIQNKLAIDYDWDLMIDDIVVDDYLPVGIIGRDEVTVIRRKPITGHSNKAINDIESKGPSKWKEVSEEDYKKMMAERERVLKEAEEAEEKQFRWQPFEGQIATTDPGHKI
ncbi:unnamed protein product [Oppiella nova]|uniref:Uncharacterized protein n=1 Tax=Oppiella nova TaxID=334625 RepID=A0A7R9MFH5_9ACAR|nr:unnamed protein product [Oppiella nova]CAG2176438.1 unnamed protein product [Oppiella nova]